MTMKINESIVSEHVEIKVFLGVVNVIFKKLYDGSPIPKEHLEQLVEFMTDYIDSFHHLKEEKILFKYLEKYEMYGKDDLVGELNADHTMGRMLKNSLADSIDSYDPDNKEWAKGIATTLQLFSATLIHHICREDTELIPYVEEQLSDEQKQTIEKEYAELQEDFELSKRELSKLDQLVVYYEVDVAECKKC